MRQLEERKKKSQAKRERKATGEEQERNKRSRMQKGVFVAGKGSTVLTETEELDSINYRPKTKQSR